MWIISFFAIIIVEKGFVVVIVDCGMIERTEIETSGHAYHGQVQARFDGVMCRYFFVLTNLVEDMTARECPRVRNPRFSMIKGNLISLLLIMH